MLPVDPFLAVAIYIIAWWMSFFVMLPIGVKGVHEDPMAPAGHDPGAPQAPNLKKKVVWAAGLGFVVWAIAMAVIALDPWSVRGG